MTYPVDGVSATVVDEQVAAPVGHATQVLVAVIYE